MFSLISNDIGIDLGTSSILVYIKGRGVVLKEPSVVAVNRDTNTVLAYGEDAGLMLGRTPENISAVRPLRQGVISDYTLTEKMLKYFINKAVGKRTLRRPRSRRRPSRMPLTTQVPARSRSSRSRWQQPSVPASTSVSRRAT